MVAKKGIELTKEGVEQLNKELRHLIDVERPHVIEQLQNARSMGDLSENADYDSARNRQAEVEGRIKEIEAILADATVVKDNNKAQEVKISNTVTFIDLLKNEEKTVKIVSSIEANPLSSDNIVKISNVCPLGVALVGHKVDEVVTVKTVKPYDIKIISIK